MKIEYALEGFATTDHLVFCEAIPAEHLAEVFRIAEVPASDPDCLGSYNLDRSQATAIAALIGVARLPTHALIYQLGNYTVDP